MTVKSVLCTVCQKEDEPVKYKCPTCRIPYCSVSCYKQHKLVGCNVESWTNDEEPMKKQTSSSKYYYPTEDTIPIEKLHLLRQNKKLKNILGNPHLRSILESVNSANNPTELIHEAMLEPIFVEFADECLKVVQEP